MDEYLQALVMGMPEAVSPPEEGLAWPPKHETCFKHIGMPRRPGLAQRARYRKQLAHPISQLMWDRLCNRQHDIIIYYTLLWIESGRHGEWAVDTSQNLWRLPVPAVDLIPCLTGTSRIWLIKEQRLLMGQEALALQGLNQHDISCFSSFSNSLQWSLAGNAFTGAVAAAVFLAANGAHDVM